MNKANIIIYKLFGFAAIITGIWGLIYSYYKVFDNFRSIEVLQIGVLISGFATTIIIAGSLLIVLIEILESLKANGQKTRQLIERRLQRELKEQQKN